MGQTQRSRSDLVSQSKLLSFSTLAYLEITSADNSKYSTDLRAKLSQDQISLIDFIKNTGNNIAHQKFDKDDLLKALEDEDDDADTKKDKATLVQMLEQYCKNEGKPFGVGPFTKI